MRRDRPPHSPPAGRNVSSTVVPPAAVSSGYGPATGSTGRPSTWVRTAPSRIPVPASGERALESEESPGRIRCTVQSPSRHTRLAPSSPIARW